MLWQSDEQQLLHTWDTTQFGTTLEIKSQIKTACNITYFTSKYCHIVLLETNKANSGISITFLHFRIRKHEGLNWY